MAIVINGNLRRAGVRAAEDEGLVISTDPRAINFIGPGVASAPNPTDPSIIDVTLAAGGSGLSFTTAGRPAANTLAAGTRIWNTSTHRPNYSGGALDNNWYDADGNNV